jgi:hypothetical protein
LSSIYQSSENHPSFLRESISWHENNLSRTSDNEYGQALLLIRLLENVFRGVACRSTNFLQHDLTTFSFTCDNINKKIIPAVKYFTYYTIFNSAAIKPIDIENRQHINHLLHPSGKYINSQLIFEEINWGWHR